MKNRFRPQDQEGSSQGILEPDEPINSLRGVECTDNEKESLGSWRHRPLVQQHTDFGLAGSRQGYSQALMALSCFPPPSQPGENREPMASLSLLWFPGM